MRIYIDTREKPNAIRHILAAFYRAGVEVIHQKLDEGDYKTAPDALFSIDRKQNLSEVVNNLTWDAGRFQRELRRAKEKGERLLILVDNCPGIRCVEDVARWNNSRCRDSPKAVSGPHLCKMMLMYSAQYGIEWRFSDGTNTGSDIIRILSEQAEGSE